MGWEQNTRPPSDYLHPRKKARVLARHAGICTPVTGPDGVTYGCGHPGADTVDHAIPWAEWDNPSMSVHTEANLHPMHGQPCPTCGRSCHEDKTKAEAARGRERAQAKRKTQAKRPDEAHPGSLTQAHRD